MKKNWTLGYTFLAQEADINPSANKPYRERAASTDFGISGCIVRAWATRDTLALASEGVVSASAGEDAAPHVT